MKKTTILITAAVLLVIIVSCKDLKRNNPYDPSGSAYGGITYKGDVWYPDNADISAMKVVSGSLVFGGYNPVDGDCVMKMTGDSTYYPVGFTGDLLLPGNFHDIKDLCGDDSGNVYVVDNKPMVQVISAANVITTWSIAYTTGIDNLSIECLNNSIFISNYVDKTIGKYTLSGVYVDSLVLSSTSYGVFIPGRIFKGASHLYVVNALDKKKIVKLSDTLANAGEFDFQDNIMDGAVAGQQLQLAATQAVYKVDSDLGLSLKWGNFGVGPGRVLNGKLVAYDRLSNLVYVQDGLTIKKFGE